MKMILLSAIFLSSMGLGYLLAQVKKGKETDIYKKREKVKQIIREHFPNVKHD